MKAASWSLFSGESMALETGKETAMKDVYENVAALDWTSIQVQHRDHADGRAKWCVGRGWSTGIGRSFERGSRGGREVFLW